MSEVEWRRQAAMALAPALQSYNEAIKDSIGLRLQDRLSDEQAEEVARCKAFHRDISLNF